MGRTKDNRWCGRRYRRRVEHAGIPSAEPDGLLGPKSVGSALPHRLERSIHRGFTVTVIVISNRVFT